VDLTSPTLPDARPHAIITEAEDGGVETMGYEVANTRVSGWSSSALEISTKEQLSMKIP
ncbi:hypothetical protein FIBSPDRAFT_848819, partial [Athelia psychrophila]